MAENNIKKQVETINKQEKGLRLLREKAKTRCTHTRKGELDIVPAKDRKQGELKYICCKCGKELYLNKIDEQTLRGACTVVDNSCDVIKLSLDPDRDEDAQVLKNVAKTQYRVRNEILKLYAAALAKNKKGGKRRGNNQQGSGFNRPVTR